MLNNLVPIFDRLAGRLISGVLNMSSGHPVMTCILLAASVGAVALAWADLLGGDRSALPADDERAIRLRRR